MTEDEYYKWKNECPNEWKDMYIYTIKSFINNTYLKGMENDDIAILCPDTDKNKQVYTVKKLCKSLIDEDYNCDSLIMMNKEILDVTKSNK